MPSKSRGKSPSLQDLRKGLAKLKRAGLIDIKSPSTARGTAKNKALLKKFSAVAADRADVVRISKTTAAKYKAAKTPGVKIVETDKGLRAIVTKSAGYSKTQIAKGAPFEGMIARVRKVHNGKIEKVIFPTDSKNLDSFVKQIRDNPQFNNLLNGRFQFTIMFNTPQGLYGLNKPVAFSSMQALADYLVGYKSFVAAAKSSRKAQRDYLNMIEIVRVTRGNADMRNAMQMAEARKREGLKREAKKYKKQRKQRRG